MMAPSHTLMRLASGPARSRQYIAARRTISSASRPMRVLGIETSADDTCVALMSFRTKSGQDEVGHIVDYDKVTYANKKHKGIHPVEAVMSHTQNLSHMVSSVIAKGRLPKPDLVCVTRGPGMGGCLSVGVTTAKALSATWDVPIVGVHHMQAHALTPAMERALGVKPTKDEFKYPFLTLLVSGKHTMLVHTKSPVDHRILAQTQFNALGDVLDKVAREFIPKSWFESQPDDIPICYPQIMEQMIRDRALYYLPAQSREDEIKVYQSEYGWELQPPLRKTKAMKYDFNGLFSTTLGILRAQPEMSKAERLQLGTQFMRLAFEHVMSRVIIALQTDQDLLRDPPTTLILSGGVARNMFLRLVIEKTLERRGFNNIKLHVPHPRNCTDNAEMIAYAGWKMYTNGWETDKNFCPAVTWSIEEILSGVDCWKRRPGFLPVIPEDAQSKVDEPNLANNEASSVDTSVMPQDPSTSPSEHKQPLPRPASFFSSISRQSGTESPGDETPKSPGEELEHIDMPSNPLEQPIIRKASKEAGEEKEQADMPSHPSEQSAICKTYSKGPGDEMDEADRQLEWILRQAESILDKLDPASRDTSTPRNVQASLRTENVCNPVAQSSTPKQDVATPPPADHEKPTTTTSSNRESLSTRGVQSADDKVSAKASETNRTANKERRQDEERSATLNANTDGAPKGKSQSMRDQAPVKAPASPTSSRDTLRVTTTAQAADTLEKPSAEHEMAGVLRSATSTAASVPVPVPVATPVAPTRKPATAPAPPPMPQLPRVGKVWPPVPSPTERHDLKIHYVGFADDPAPSAKKPAPTFMSKVASIFGLGQK